MNNDTTIGTSYKSGHLYADIDGSRGLTITHETRDEHDYYRFDGWWWDIAYDGLSNISNESNEEVTNLWGEREFIEFLKENGGDPKANN